MSIENAYDQWSEQYDHNKNNTRDLDKLVTKTVLGNINFKTVLELGCGTGKNTEWLLNHAEDIFAIDLSEKMLALAKKKIQSPKVQFEKADITRTWNWAPAKFDLICFNLILEHIEDLNFIFEQAEARLNPGGFIFISELHPFKQYKGSKARFDSNTGVTELETYTHHISEFLS
ncbi:MAG: class I SAM-dependent methyltransferase, partial [Gramella sp.]|nr:class I SAM-dependent methyltransferase [Christiangramia sp.]